MIVCMGNDILCNDWEDEHEHGASTRLLHHTYTFIYIHRRQDKAQRIVIISFQNISTRTKQQKEMTLLGFRYKHQQIFTFIITSMRDDDDGHVVYICCVPLCFDCRALMRIYLLSKTHLELWQQ